MLFFLFSLVLSKTIADIEPPIELDSDGTVNLWEFSGSATVYPDSVMLLPPIQFRRGCGWTTVDIPKQSFGITFDLVISDGDRGSALGIWMVDKYAQDGPLAGGPSVFNGLGLILPVKRIGAKTIISLNILQSKGTQEFKLESLPKEDAAFEVQENVEFSVHLEFGSTVSVGLIVDGEYAKLVEKPIEVDLSQNYIGITASNGNYASRVDINGIHFNIDSIENHRDPTMPESAQEDRYNPLITGLFRNPIFNKTDEERENYINDDNITTEKTAMDVIAVIDECSAAAYMVPEFKDVNNFVRKTLIPYSEKWQRRSIKIVESMKGARKTMENAWNFTETLIQDFNSTIEEAVLKTSLKIITLSEIILEESEDPIMLPANKDVTRSLTVDVLIFISFLELACLIGFIIITRIFLNAKPWGSVFTK